MQIVGHAVHLCNSRCSRRPRKGGEVVHLNPNTRPLSLVRIVQGLEKCVVKARQEDIEAVCRKMVGTKVRAQGCVGTRAAHLGLLLVRPPVLCSWIQKETWQGTKHLVLWGFVGTQVFLTANQCIHGSKPLLRFKYFHFMSFKADLKST